MVGASGTPLVSNGSPVLERWQWVKYGLVAWETLDTTPADATFVTNALASSGNNSGNAGNSGASSAATSPVPPSASSNITGQDANGYNTGPACSDDPASSLPACSDAPSIPAMDAVGSCANGLTIDRTTTTCGLAESVFSHYHNDGVVTATSPTTEASFDFRCTTGGSGTTGYTICLGQSQGSELYVRWSGNIGTAATGSTGAGSAGQERTCFYYSNSGWGLWATANLTCTTAKRVYTDAMKQVPSNGLQGTISVDGYQCKMNFNGGGEGTCTASGSGKIRFEVP